MYCLVSDIHFHNWSAFSKEDGGINSRLNIIIEEMRKVLNCALSEGANVYMAGDLFHVRGSLAPSVVNPVKNLFREYTELGVKIRAIPGNHDLESNESSEMGSAVEVLAPCGVIVSPDVVYYADDNVLMVPWRSKCEDLLDELNELADKHPGADLIIHAPVNGILIGVPDHGIWASQLRAFGFKRVFAGHYHNFKEIEDTIYSIGALTHQTWSDVGTFAGYLTVTDTEVCHLESQSPSFIDIDAGMTEADLRAKVPGNYVRLKIGEATEAQIKDARKELIALGAEGISIQAIPVTKITARTGTVKSGASVMESINEWLKVNPPASANNDVTKICESILEEVESEDV